MSGTLLPCPFCGEKESLYVRHVEGTILHPAYFVACDNCGAQGATTDKGDHEKEWNARGIAPPVAAGSVDNYSELTKLIFDRYPRIKGAFCASIAIGLEAWHNAKMTAWGAQQRHEGFQEGVAQLQQAEGKHPAPCTRDCEANAFQIEVRRLEAESAHKQSIIDRLMLEYCPDEMTLQQVKEWGEHQVRAPAGIVGSGPNAKEGDRPCWTPDCGTF